MNPVTLTKRLKKLESEGIIGQHTETMDKLSVSYYLEKKGKRMLPVINKGDAAVCGEVSLAKRDGESSSP